MEKRIEYFEELLNQNYVPDIEEGNKANEDRGNEDLDQEVEEAIKGLKKGKALGIDKITAEILKNMGAEGGSMKRALKTWFIVMTNVSIRMTTM